MLNHRNVTGKLRDDDIEEIIQDDPEKDVWLNEFPGAMYEKLNAWDITRSGHGGEYEIQTGVRLFFVPVSVSNAKHRILWL